MSEWQPIESAPKDGSRILAAIKHGSQKIVCIAAFAKNGVLYDEREDSCVGWVPWGKDGRLSADLPVWQPLPAPPK